MRLAVHAKEDVGSNERTALSDARPAPSGLPWDDLRVCPGRRRGSREGARDRA